MRFQFSLARLLLAVAAFAVVLGAFMPLGPDGYPDAVLVASAVGLIVLISTKRDVKLILLDFVLLLFGIAELIAIIACARIGRELAFGVGLLALLAFIAAAVMAQRWNR